MQNSLFLSNTFLPNQVEDSNSAFLNQSYPLYDSPFDANNTGKNYGIQNFYNMNSYPPMPINPNFSNPQSSMPQNEEMNCPYCNTDPFPKDQYPMPNSQLDSIPSNNNNNMNTYLSNPPVQYTSDYNYNDNMNLYQPSYLTRHPSNSSKNNMMYNSSQQMNYSMKQMLPSEGNPYLNGNLSPIHSNNTLYTMDQNPSYSSLYMNSTISPPLTSSFRDKNLSVDYMIPQEILDQLKPSMFSFNISGLFSQVQSLF